MNYLVTNHFQMEVELCPFYLAAVSKVTMADQSLPLTFTSFLKTTTVRPDFLDHPDKMALSFFNFFSEKKLDVAQPFLLSRSEPFWLSLSLATRLFSTSFWPWRAHILTTNNHHFRHIWTTHKMIVEKCFLPWSGGGLMQVDYTIRST